MGKSWTGRRGRAAGGNLILLIFGVALALGLAELAARQLPGRPYAEDNGDLWACERLVGWRGKPNTNRIVNTQGYEHEVIRNSAGMHDDEHSLAKPDNVFRILVIGDSFVEARQVTTPESSHSVLEETLNATAPPNLSYEVINAGASAWGPAQALMYFRSEGRRYAPDLVVNFWYPANDLSDILPDHRMTFEGTNCYAPYFVRCDQQFDPNPWYSAPGLSPTYKQPCSSLKKATVSFLNWLYFKSRLYQRLEPLLAGHQAKVKYEFEFSPWLENRPDETLDYAYQITDGIFSQLATEAGQIGAKSAIIVVPLKEAVYYELGSPYREQFEAEYPDLKNVNPELPSQKINALMTPKGVPVLDLQPFFVEHLKRGGGVLYWEVDSHWNVPGNRFSGERVAQWLIEQKLVPAPR